MRVVEVLNRFFRADVGGCADADDLYCLYDLLGYDERCELLHDVAMAVAQAVHGGDAKVVMEFCFPRDATPNATFMVLKPAGPDTYRLVEKFKLNMFESLKDLEERFFAS